MKQFETWVLVLVIVFTLVWSAKAFKDLNDGRVSTVVHQLVK